MAEKVKPEAPVVDTALPYTTAYTDGSSTGGWGPGGWGWCVIDGPRAGAEGSGGEGWTTNQQMEVMAAWAAMVALPGLLLIVSDSAYVVNGFTQWQEGWRRRNWHKVSNSELWQPAVDCYLDRAGEVRFQWVKGHAGLPGNERADKLCKEARLAVPQDEWGPPDPTERSEYLRKMTANGKMTK